MAHAGDGQFCQKRMDPGVIVNESLKIPLLLSRHSFAPHFENVFGVPAQQRKTLPIRGLVKASGARTERCGQRRQLAIVDQPADVTIPEPQIARDFDSPRILDIATKGTYESLQG
jgi:hypothetical protein